MNEFERGYHSFSGVDIKAKFGDKELGKIKSFNISGVLVSQDHLYLLNSMSMDFDIQERILC